MIEIKKNDIIVFFNLRLENGQNIDDIKNFIIDLSNDNLEDTSKKLGLAGRFRVTNKNKYHNLINNSVLILFKCNNLILGMAQVDKAGDGYPYEITHNLRKHWLYDYDKNGKSLINNDIFDAYYYQLYNIKLLPMINYNDIVGKDKNSILLSNGKAFKGAYEAVKVNNVIKLINYLSRKETNEIFNSKLGKKLKEQIPYSLLKQIDFYALENVHTAFLKNFLVRNNIFNLGNRPLNKLLNLIKLRYNNISNNILNFTGEHFSVSSQKRVARLQPDMILESEHYRIIIENKFFAVENENQTLNYYKYFETLEDKKKNICVCISLSRLGKVSVEEYYNISVVKLLFKDILREIYLPFIVCDNNVVLKEYLNSYFYLVNPEFNLNIDIVPYIKNLIDEDDCFNFYINNKDLFDKIKNLELAVQSSCEFDILLLRYVVVILYNNFKKYKIDKSELIELYNKI